MSKRKCYICGSHDVPSEAIMPALEGEFGEMFGLILCNEHFALVTGAADYVMKHDAEMTREEAVKGCFIIVQRRYMAERN